MGRPTMFGVSHAEGMRRMTVIDHAHERLEGERVQAALRGEVMGGTDGEFVQTPWGPRRLVRIGTGQLTPQQEREARERSLAAVDGPPADDDEVDGGDMEVDEE